MAKVKLLLLALGAGVLLVSGARHLVAQTTGGPPISKPTLNGMPTLVVTPKLPSECP